MSARGNCADLLGRWKLYIFGNAIALPAVCSKCASTLLQLHSNFAVKLYLSFILDLKCSLKQILLELHPRFKRGNCKVFTHYSSLAIERNIALVSCIHMLLFWFAVIISQRIFFCSVVAIYMYYPHRILP